MTDIKRHIVLVALGGVAAACGLLEPTSRDFVIRIDSVSSPGAVSGGAPFQVLFFGSVGPDGCYRLKRFQVSQSTTVAEISVIGTRTAGMCTQMPINLHGEPLTIEPPVTDPFVLSIHEPDGSRLSRTIRVQ